MIAQTPSPVESTVLPILRTCERSPLLSLVRQAFLFLERHYLTNVVFVVLLYRYALGEGLHLPRRRSGPQAGHPLPSVRWWYR